VSNLILICPKCNTSSKVRVAPVENGRRARICRSCGEVIGATD
jgi:hypothetical protein